MDRRIVQGKLQWSLPTSGIQWSSVMEWESTLWLMGIEQSILQARASYQKESTLVNLSYLSFFFFLFCFFNPFLQFGHLLPVNTEFTKGIIQCTFISELLSVLRLIVPPAGEMPLCVHHLYDLHAPAYI